MAKESILFNEENRDAQLAIVVILGLILLFMYPLTAVWGDSYCSAVYHHMGVG
jgi:uncharacterized membrane protein YadS